jgi:hypothetical protein
MVVRNIPRGHDLNWRPTNIKSATVFYMLFYMQQCYICYAILYAIFLFYYFIVLRTHQSA